VRPTRILLAVLLVVGGLGSSLLLASKAARSLRDSPYATQLPDPKVPAAGAAHRGKAHRSTGSQRARPGASSPGTRRHSHSDWVLGVDVGSLLLIAALEAGGGVLLLGVLLGVLTVRRVRMRTRRRYAVYELHLSPHDNAKPQDLEDMVESIANIVRAWPSDRACSGQPYVAIELICTNPERPGLG
jgi:hypothetical protein